MDEQCIGNKLKFLRQRQNMKQSSLADALSVSTSTISHWENGRRIPSVIELMRIAEYFQVDVNVFLISSNDDTLVLPRRETFNPHNNLYTPMKLPFLKIYVIISLGIFVLLSSCILFQQLIGYVMYGLALISLFVLVVFYTYRQISHQKTISKQDSFIQEDAVMYRHKMNAKEIEKARLILLSLAILSIIGLFLFFVFYTLLLLANMFVITPFIVTGMGITLLSVKVRLYHIFVKRHPYLHAFSYKNQRIQKGSHLLHSIMALDTIIIISLLFHYLLQQSYLCEYYTSWIGIFGLMTLTLDASIVYLYQDFTSSFDLINKNNDQLLFNSDEPRGML